MTTGKTNCFKSIPLIINPRGAAAIAFFVPIIIYFIFRINLAPLFNIDARFVVGSSNMDISTVFSGNPYQYRPLSLLLEAKIGYLYKLYGTNYHTDVIGIIAVLHGLLSLLIYGICFNYCRCKLTSLLASFLYMFSVAGIDATWHNLFSAFMIGPILATCLAVFAYQQFCVITNRWRWFWLAAFIISCLIAPWFRELGYVPAATVFAIELLHSLKKRSLFFLLPGILFMHALIPKALPSLLGLYHGPIKFMFREGNINTNIFSPSLNTANDSGFWWVISSLIRRDTAGFIINEIPPLLWLCIIPVIAHTTVTTFLHLFSRVYGKGQFQPQRITEQEGLNLTSPADFRIAYWVGVSMVFIILLFLIHSILAINLVGATTVRFLPFIFLVLLTLLATLRFGILFPVWFMVTVPSLMLLGANEEIHTAFAMPPFVIICSLYCRELVSSLFNLRLSLLRQIFSVCIGAALAIVFFDHISNVATSFFDIQSITTSHQRISRWLEDNAQDRAVIFTDFGAASDIFYMLKPSSQGYKFEPTSYEIIGGSPNTPQLDIIQQAVAKKRKVYYIHLKTYSTDQSLPLPVNAIKKLATFEVDNFGFMLDPLRFAVDKQRYPRRFVPSEWDNSYGWVGYGTSRFIWCAEIEIYKLMESKAATLDVLSFKNPNRSSLPPKEAGDDAVF